MIAVRAETAGAARGTTDGAGDRWQSALRYLDRLARRHWTILLPAAFAAVVRLALLPWMGEPLPATQDEFSYLLAGDTFSHGRLTNPMHPLWRFFETMHVLSVPTYASKYQAGPAVFLALGERAFGHPFFGVILETALFVAAVTWMLRAWAPPGFSLTGGLLTAIEFGAGHYWLESYFGSEASAAGAALVIGALGRIRSQGRLTMEWPLAAGIVLIWFTRPFEGGFLVLAVGFVLLWSLVRHRVSVNATFMAVLAACGMATLALQGYYDYRVTGSATTLPYSLDERQYSYAPAL